MTKAEAKIFDNLSCCHATIGIVLNTYPVSRNLSNEDFVRFFLKVWKGKKFSYESITRCRRFIQNTCGMFKKAGAVTTWKEAIKQLKEGISK